MSRYDGLIIPRSYSEYLNKTDSATLSQMLQHLTGLWSHAVSAGDQKPVTSNAVYESLTDAVTIQQALQLPGVLSEVVAAGDNKAVKSSAVNAILSNELKNKSYGEDIIHSNGQYAKLTINVTVRYSTSIIALMGRGASLALIGICANDTENVNVRTYLKDKGLYGNGEFFYIPISKNSIELYWNANVYSNFSNYQIIANTKNTEVTADIVNSLPAEAIKL